LEDASDVTVWEKSHRGLHCGLKDLVLNPPLKIEKLAIPADIQAERARDCAHAIQWPRGGNVYRLNAKHLLENSPFPYF